MCVSPWLILTIEECRKSGNEYFNLKNILIRSIIIFMIFDQIFILVIK